MTDKIELPQGVHEMMLKLRKGAAASLNAARFKELLPYLPGWTMERQSFVKPSDGGWLISEVPGCLPGKRASSDGRIHIKERLLLEVGTAEYERRGRAEDERKIAFLLDSVYPRLVELVQSAEKRARWYIADLEISEVAEGDEITGVWRKVDVSFQLLAVCAGWLIASPDGQTYEVFGDYKNGAIGAQTFSSFFAWAVDNTNFLELILDVLGMEPVEEKVDPTKPYTPPPTAPAQVKWVHAKLKAMTEGIRAEQKDKLIARMGVSVARLRDLLEAQEFDKALKLAANSHVVTRVFDRKNKCIVDDVSSIIDMLAESDVTAMQNAFVYKNTMKLASVLAAKGGEPKMDVRSISARGGVIEASLHFSFDDGSAFKVRQSIVQSYAVDRFQNVTPFWRFPTTFHDVLLPGGIKMGMPSEERMNEVFVKAVAA